jgi:hypothetical protein
MALFQVTEGLFRDDQEETLRQATQTHIGMAHFAGTGPVDKTCRECVYWMKRGKWTKADLMIDGRVPEPSPCRRYRNLLNLPNRGLPAVPHDAAACKWFGQAERPQPLKPPSY